MRAAIYARYSSDNQRDASIEDQIEVCQRYAAQMGWQVTTIFDDRAISGANSNRPGYRDLVTETRRGTVDVVIVEALDRLGRKLSDISGMFDELQFRGIALHAVNVGPVTTMHVGLLGTMAQLYLADLRDKTRRGQLGRVRKGKAAGGLASGYRLVHDSTSERGGRRIDEAEATVVRRIFKDFASGRSPRAIAKQLNAEAVPGPGGRPWQDTTVRGQAERGTGILNNSLYVGILAWNRCSFIKDPQTGRRLARPNPPAQWERVAVPELRIIDDMLWQRVKERQRSVSFAMGRDAAGNALNRAHRRKFLLSGLLVCGQCGAGYTIVAKDRYGCAGHRSKGTCANERTIDRLAIEARVLDGLRSRLLAPEHFEVFARAFHEERRRLAKQATGERTMLDRRLAEVGRRIDAIIRAIEDGLYQPSMKSRLADLETQKAQLEVALADLPAESPVQLHPNLPALFRRKVEQLEELVTHPELAIEAMERMRGLIGRIVLTPDAAGGLAVELHGELAAILQISEAAQTPNARLAGGRFGSVREGQVSVVAGARNHLNLLFNAPHPDG